MRHFEIAQRVLQIAQIDSQHIHHDSVGDITTVTCVLLSIRWNIDEIQCKFVRSILRRRTNALYKLRMLYHNNHVKPVDGLTYIANAYNCYIYDMDTVWCDGSLPLSRPRTDAADRSG